MSARALLMLLLLALQGCVGLPVRAGWREAPPLPDPRWFHRAASDLEGRLYAFGGRVAVVPGAREMGLGRRSLDILEVGAQRWRRGPRLPMYRARNRMKIRMKKAGDIVSPPIREWVEEYDYEIALLAEVPPGTAGRDGLIYWFQEPGPIVFDHSTESWDQPYVALSDSDRPGWVDPVPRLVRQASVTATAPDGKIYHVGGLGYPLQRSERDPRGTHKWSLLAAMEVFDPATHTWTERAPMQRARQLFAGTFGRDGRLYVFGGYGHAGSVRASDSDSEERFLEAAKEMKFLGRNALTSTEIYDPATDTWIAGAPMPYGRNAMGAALGADGRIYVVGGAVSYSSPVPRADVFVYDPAKDRWEIGPRLRRRRYHHAVTVDPKGRIYAIGGIAGKRLLSMAPTDSVEVLDTSAVVDTKTAPEPRAPASRSPEPPGPELEHQE